MIELIFAIVLIGLVVVAVPEMITRNVNTMSGNLVQEELFFAAKTASELLTQPWDTRSVDTSTSKAYTKVLDTKTIGTGGLARQTDAGDLLPFRIGHIREDNHRRFYNIETWPADYKIPKEDKTPFLPDHTTLTITSGYTGQTSAGFFTTAPVTSNATPNISAAKMATITVTNDTDAARTVTLRVYMANIGEYSYASRRF